MQAAHQREWENRQKMLNERFIGTCAVFTIATLPVLLVIAPTLYLIVTK